ncbi:MAG: iron-sulfur cluster assembly protein [Bacteroidota bacterium]|nr:iron-sulfur cluster assembly protein [Bacteroidota bacterium]
MEQERNEIQEKVITALKQVYDPEIPVNIYDLGLIYELRIEKENVVYIKMTLTAPTCPIAEDIPGMVRSEVMKVGGVKEVVVDLVFDPPWDIDRINDAAKLELGLI